MTTMKEEESFPRGRLAGTKPALRKVKDKLFQKHKKPKRPSKNSFIEENPFKAKFKKSLSKGIHEPEPRHIIKPLTYQILEEGMVVVGRVKEIHPYHLFVCLPGKLSAKVPISAISKPYSDSLARLQKLEITQKECPSLNDIFAVGQTVVCSIVEVKKERNLLAVSASLDPTLVNKERSHHVIRAGHTLVAAVNTIEDHGYTLHTGIGGLTTFLKFANATKHVELKNHGRSLVVGELVRCVVTKCTTGRSASRAEVTLDPRVLAETTISDGNAQTLHPGTAVSCVVKESTRAGLVVTIGRYTAYVEAAQLPSCWSSYKYIQPEEDLNGTVIYSLPNTDFQITARPTYLTLKSISQPTSPKMAIGDVIEASVVQSGPKGLLLCLGNTKDKDLGNKGFVSIRRLGEVIPKDKVVSKFPRGTVVTTKILGFDFMEEIYNCTLESHKLEQDYVCAAQVKVGDRVSCKVLEVEATGLRLGLGPVKLYAFKEHSADEPYADLHQHFRIGDIVDARVLKVNPSTRQAYVTLKETLIRSPALMSYETANEGEGYWGTVRTINQPGRLYVTFYNDVAGVVNLKDIPSSQYKPGQLVKCYVRNVNAAKRKLSLGLFKPKRIRQMKQLTTGQLYQLVVTDVGQDHLKVSCCDFEGVGGIVPRCHLPDPDKVQEGDFIRAWLYHNYKDINLFSPNSSMEHLFKNQTNINVRSRMTCCVCAIKKTYVMVLTGLPDMPTADVSKEEWPENEQPYIHQLVKLFVQEYNPESKTLILTYKKPPKQGNVSISEVNGPSEKRSSGKHDSNINTKNITQDKIVQTYDTVDKIVQTDDTVEKLEQNIDKDNLVVSSKKKRKLSESSFEETKKADPNTWSIEKQSKKEKSKNITKHDTKEQGEGEKTKKVIGDALKKTNLKVSKIDSENGLASNDIDSDDSFSDDLACNDLDLNTSDFDSDDSSSETKKKKKKQKPEREEEVRKSEKKAKKINSSKTESDEKSNGIVSDKKSKKRTSSLSSNDTIRQEEEAISLSQSKKPKLTLKETGFNWDIKPEDLVKPSEVPADDIDEDDDEKEGKKKKKTAADRRQAAKEEEARLRLVEQTLLDSESNPQSADQFDRAVLARPDDDELWIKYMSHHLQATEIEKARAVAKRALKTINQRLEVERLNVWIALLNLENLFGTQETLKNTLDEALRANDEFAVYTKMLNIYCQASKAQECEQLVHTMLRKFRDSLECWVACCSSLMTCGLTDKARNLLQRAISTLPTKEHVTLLCKFALLENQHGFGEQAQTLFEHILTTYPKRTDIWNVYVDMLVKSDKVNVAREILERATRQKLPPRKMKMLFNKWISFEEKNGTPEKVEHVRKQALAYVNNITNKLDDSVME